MGIQKGLVAIFGGIVSILAQFGIDVPDTASNLINGAIPLVTAVAVYFIPNKT